MFYRGHRRVGVAHLQGHGLGSFVPAAGSGDGDVGDALGLAGLEREAQQLVSLGAEVHFLGAAAGEGTIGLEGNAGLADAVLHGEHVHRGLNFLAAAHYARQGGHYHQGVLHGHGLLQVAVGAVVARHQHHAHAAHVHGKLQFQDVSALLEGAGRLEQHHGVEAVVLAGVAHGIFITADGCQRGEGAVEGANHLVIQIPGVYAQSLIFIHPGPGVRGLEGREVQQAFVYDGQRIGHGLAVLLGHLHQERFLRVNHVRQLDYRLQVGGGVLHLDALYTVQAQRKVVGALLIRLQQAHLHIDVGCHLRGYRKGPGRILGADGNPLAADHSASVHQLYQRLGAGGCGDEDGGLLTHLVGGFVGREGNHGEGLGIPSVGAAAVFRPVHGEGGAAHMTGGEVLG